jgi:hypothetical protein
MCSLIAAELLQVVVENAIKPGSRKIGLCVVQESFSVELILEVLKGERKVENVPYQLLAVDVFYGSNGVKTRMCGIEGYEPSVRLYVALLNSGEADTDTTPANAATVVENFMVSVK